MKAKVCYQDEIHRISKLPAKLEDLKTHVSHIFHSSLPEQWALQYIDSDQDKIMIQDEKDYEEFQKFVLSGNGASITKIYVESVMRVSSVLKGMEEDYQIIENQKEAKLDETVKIEEPQKEEEPEKEKEPKKEEEAVQEEVKPVQQQEAEKAVVEETETKGGEEETEGEKTQDVSNEAVDESVLSEKKEEEVEEKKVELMGDGRVLIDLKTLEKLMLGIIEDKIPMIILKTKEALKKDEEEEKKVEAPKEKVVKKDLDQEMIDASNLLKKKGKKCKKWRRIEPEVPREINEIPEMSQSERERFLMVNEKAEKMLKCFPKADLDLLLAFVNDCPDDMTLEELVENYKLI